MKDILKAKEKLFCYYYLKLRNEKEAAIQSGFDKKNAQKIATRLLEDKGIISFIKKIQKEINDDDIVQSVIAGFKRLAFSSSSDVLNIIALTKEELLLSIGQLDLFHVSEIKMPKENAIEIKFFDRFKALEKLMDIVDMKKDSQTANNFYNALKISADNIKNMECNNDF